MTRAVHGSERLVLGTVQLGLPYGVANSTGQPDMAEAEAIVREAWEGGIREFDTAQGYGQSEDVLGKVFARLGITDKARVITKFDPALDHTDSGILLDSLEKSRDKLGVETLEGVMLHNQDLLVHWDSGVSEAVDKAREKGIVKLAGVSVYSPDAAMSAITTTGVGMVQLPTNPLDRRFETAGVFQEAARLERRIYVRSIFLQGLLVMALGSVPKALRHALPDLNKLENMARSMRITRQTMAMLFVRQGLPDARVVFGAETADQVSENISVWTGPDLPGLAQLVRGSFPNVDETILNPTLWETAK